MAGLTFEKVSKRFDDSVAVDNLDLEVQAGEFLALMQSRGEGEPDEDVLGDAVAFEGVSKYPARIKCALLGWMAWKDATAQALDAAGRADALLTETRPAENGARETA